MPAMHFHLRWPDGSASRCYSPSLVVKDHFSVGASYPLPDFLRRIREALGIASQRVQARYGHPCSLALGQLAQIEAAALRFHTLPEAQVTVTNFEE